MSDEYSSRFGGNYVVLTNAIPTDTVVRYASMNATIRLLYAGNLSLNRWKVLALIGECLEELDKEDNLRGELSIYSVVAPRGRESSSLSRSPFCEFKGRLEPLVLRQAKIDSDILVHVEAFDRQNRSATRFSMSTKIPEYLASGRCIFAVGPGDVASMEYIAQHDLGVVAISDDRNTVKTALRRIMMDRSMRARYADRGIEIARERHNAGTIAEQVRRLLSGALDSREDNNLQSNPFRTASR
jgi:glycosyltransferase involved in cell wall biosynthesis